ncbi:MAG: hypothetical protein ACRELY_27510 [Polyangiaceae bacterium]
MKKRALLLGACLFVFASAAFAQDDPRKAQAEAVFGEGLKEHDAQHEDLALAKFEEAYKIYPSPNVLFNIGREQHLLGRSLEAIRNYRAALANQLLNPSNADLAKTYIRELQTKLGRVEVTAPRDAQVLVDGTAQTGASPYDVEPGNHKITVVAKNGKKAEKSCLLEAGDAIGMDVTGELGGDLAPQIENPPPPDREHAVIFPPPTGAIILGGLGVVGLGLGVGFGLDATSKHSSAANAEASHPCAQNPSSQACSDLQDTNKSIPTASTISIVSYIAGGALLAGGVVWWIAAPRTKRATMGITPALGPKNAGVGIGGTF